MKAISFIISLAILLVLGVSGNPLKSDFISGFEQGVLLRQNPDLALSEHECPKPAKAKKLRLDQINNILEPLKGMAKMTRD